MKVGILVNDVRTEQAGYTSLRLAVSAINLGHEVWMMGVGDLAYDPDDCDANGTTIPFSADDVFFVEAQSVMHVPAGGCGVHIVDVNDPTAPTFVSSYGAGMGTATVIERVEA